MNILHISPYVPDVRTHHAGGVLMGKEVETLKKDHRVYVLTFCNNEKESKLLEDHPDYRFIRTSRLYFIRKCLGHMLMPNMFALRRDRRFRKMICETIEKHRINVIYAEYTAMGQYWRIKKKYPGIQFHLVEHDIAIQSYERQCREAKGLLKIYKNIERIKVAGTERKYVQNADLVYVLNHKDEDLIKDCYGVKNVRVINPYYGVDFSKTDAPAEKDQAFCFVGNMGRDENHVAAMRLIRIFREMNPEGWKLNIIGAYPREELRQQESTEIHITGFVDDINADVEKNEFAVFPLTYGAGIKLKVLLAFGLGLPVVTGAVGAEGIDPDGRVLLLAETDDEYRQQMEKLMGSRELRRQIGAASAEYVKDRFGWKQTEKLYQEVYGNTNPKNG